MLFTCACTILWKAWGSSPWVLWQLLSNQYCLKWWQCKTSVLQLACTTGGWHHHPPKFAMAISEIILPSLDIILKKLLGQHTAHQWLHKLGYWHVQFQKGVYMDSHKHLYVVKYWNEQFLPQMLQYECCMTHFEGPDLEWQLPKLQEGQLEMIALIMMSAVFMHLISRDQDGVHLWWLWLDKWELTKSYFQASQEWHNPSEKESWMANLHLWVHQLCIWLAGFQGTVSIRERLLPNTNVHHRGLMSIWRIWAHGLANRGLLSSLDFPRIFHKSQDSLCHSLDVPEHCQAQNIEGGEIIVFHTYCTFYRCHNLIINIWEMTCHASLPCGMMSHLGRRLETNT